MKNIDKILGKRKNYHRKIVSTNLVEIPEYNPVFELTQAHDVREWYKDPSKINSIQPCLSKFINLYSGRKEIKIFDVGCYGGYFYEYLIKNLNVKNIIYKGVDIQEDAVFAALHLHENIPNVSFETMDLFDIPEKINKNSFDVVFCSRVLIHIPDFYRAVKSLSHASEELFLIAKVSEKGKVEEFTETFPEENRSVKYWLKTISISEIEESMKKIGYNYETKKIGTYSYIYAKKK